LLAPFRDNNVFRFIKVFVGILQAYRTAAIFDIAREDPLNPFPQLNTYEFWLIKVFVGVLQASGWS